MVNTSSHFRNSNEEYNFIFWSASALPSQLLNALHPYISIHFLHTALYTFPKGPTRRICITIKGFLNQWLFSLFSWPLHLIQRWWCGEKLEAWVTLRGLRVKVPYNKVFLLSVLGSCIAIFIIMRSQLQNQCNPSLKIPHNTVLLTFIYCVQ